VATILFQKKEALMPRFDIRLIWDFWGDSAAETAAHHLTHLEYYLQKTGISFIGGTTASTNDHHSAWIKIEEQHLTLIKQQLRPHRGERML
jgi:hypothetical protein